MKVRPLTVGLTLVELLACLAIVGLLMGLLLPAVNAAREGARRAECVGHARNLALACQQHLAAHGFFPSGGWSGKFIGDPARGYGADQPGSWLFSAAPYFEARSTDLGASSGAGAFPLAKSLAELYQSAPAILYCPSRRAAAAYPIKRQGNGALRLLNSPGAMLLGTMTKSDYAANSGDAVYSSAVGFVGGPELWTPPKGDLARPAPRRWTATDDPGTRFFQSGVCFYRSEIRAAEVTGGMSHTYLLGEKYLDPRFYESVEGTDDPEMLGDNQAAWVGYEWDNHRAAWNPDSRRDPSSHQPARDGAGAAFAGLYAFGSAHPASLQMAYCDGSVRSLAYDVDAAVHRAHARRMPD